MRDEAERRAFARRFAWALVALATIWTVVAVALAALHGTDAEGLALQGWALVFFPLALLAWVLFVSSRR